MTYTIQIQVVHIDGEEECSTLMTPSRKAALDFLAREDHEGSQLTVTVVGYDEEAYQLLRPQEKRPDKQASNPISNRSVRPLHDSDNQT